LSEAFATISLFRENSYFDSMTVLLHLDDTFVAVAGRQKKARDANAPGFLRLSP
jgi:hypothetical protein